MKKYVAELIGTMVLVLLGCWYRPVHMEDRRLQAPTALHLML